MTNLSSPNTAKNKFIVFGGGFSGDYFAKSIRKLGCIALASSLSVSNEPNSFIFNSEDNSIPTDSVSYTHLTLPTIYSV